MTVKALGKQLMEQDNVFRSVITKAGLLECVIEKTRSEQIKNTVHYLLSALKVFRDSRDQVTRSFNAVTDIVRMEEAAKSAKIVVAAPAAIKKKNVGTQSPCWWDAPPPPGQGAEQCPTNQPGPNWTEVVKRKKKISQKPTMPEDLPGDLPGDVATIVQGRTLNRKVRSRPPALLVEVKADELPALARKIRGGVDREIIGDSIIGMRQAKSGGLLIEVRGDQGRLDAVRSEISRSAGPEVEVRAIQQKIKVEVRDLDQWSTSDEVAQATAATTGVPLEQLKVINLRRRFGGSQSALVLLPAGTASVLLSSGRIRVGMISCRVKLADQKPSCFRCLCPGHIAKECSGPDRSGSCRRCGESGHKAVACNAANTAVSAFAKSLAAEAPSQK